MYLPYYILTLALGASTPIIGKLSVVYDQAGKARIVAITNSWIQMSLRPLHDLIFKKLKRIEQDGTFDQDKPFFSLLNRIPDGQKLWGYDLSAATDRLPMDLQRDVLKLMHLPGTR